MIQDPSRLRLRPVKVSGELGPQIFLETINLCVALQFAVYLLVSLLCVSLSHSLFSWQSGLQFQTYSGPLIARRFSQLLNLLAPLRAPEA